MPDLDTQTQATLAYLRSPQGIRDRCEQLFVRAQQGQSAYFRCDLDQLQPTVAYVLQVTQETYPQGSIPFHSRWRHFEVGGIDRAAQLDQALQGRSPRERAQAKCDLAVISVLLDAGAGATWQYREPTTDHLYSRSEGLAVASFQCFCQGMFSSDPQDPYRVDGAGLAQITHLDLAEGFQVTEDNPLIGLEGRLQLLHRLAEALGAHPQLFGHPPRPGHVVECWVQGSQLSALQVLEAILLGFGSIWPGGLCLQGVPLGDVWVHGALPAAPLGANLVPFHKLSQWLTYSWLEPLQELGLEITDLEALTGLAEYRNGGLCLDLGLLQPLHADLLSPTYPPQAEIIVEWRALTLALLDRIAQQMRIHLNLSPQELPLVKVLQGGTWLAGRRLAQRRRGGTPPLQLESDGTVF